MKPAYWAVLTAICWAVGSFFEKKGVKLGNLTPVMGTTVRTAVSLLFLGLLAIPFYGEIRNAGIKPLLMVGIGGGIIAGGLGVLFLYTGLKGGQISTVMTISFCLAPVLGTILGIAFMKEKINVIQMSGMALCLIGAAMTVYFTD